MCEPAPPATASSKFSGVTQNRAVTKNKAVTKISGVTKKRGRPRIEHPLTGAELRALRRLQREQEPGRYVFISERGAPMTPDGFKKLIQRLGNAAKMPFPIHPHMLRHACGYKLANQGVDTRSLQHYLGHKNIQHTVRYTELSPERFKDFWKD